MIPPAPPLSVWQAHCLAGFFATSYVGCLYISQHTRISYGALSGSNSSGQRVRQRDDPDVLRSRLIAVSASTLLSCATLLCIIYTNPIDKFFRPVEGVHKLYLVFTSMAHFLGFTGTVGLLPSLIAPVLFLGPIYVQSLFGTLPFQRNWSFNQTVVPLFFSLIGLRNHIVAPITEEVVFRACVLAAYHLAGCSPTKMIFLSPLWFGLAHVHHGWEVYHRYGRTQNALRNAVLSTVFQTAYTTLFGFHCAYLFLGTGSIIPPIASHMFCNIMGLPGFMSDLAVFPQKRVSIVITYLLGVVGYIYTLNAWINGFQSPYWPINGDVHIL